MWANNVMCLWLVNGQENKWEFIHATEYNIQMVNNKSYLVNDGNGPSLCLIVRWGVIPKQGSCKSKGHNKNRTTRIIFGEYRGTS